MTARIGSVPRGQSFAEICVDGERLTVHTYKPDTKTENAILLLFHGKGRKADTMLESARWIADRTGINLAAPLLTQENFPNWRYHRAGTFRDGRLLPREDWTMPLVSGLVDWSREALNAPKARIYFYGHSAGGQFLSRVMAYGTKRFAARRIVIANPSIYVSPSLEEPVPYGFGGGFEAVRGEKMLKSYLRRPLTIYVGADDTAAKHLVKNAPAERQGAHRLARAQNVYKMGRRFARDRGWDFNWQFVIADGVGHSSQEMLSAPGVLDALGIRSGTGA